MRRIGGRKRRRAERITSRKGAKALAEVSKLKKMVKTVAALGRFAGYASF